VCARARCGRPPTQSEKKTFSLNIYVIKPEELGQVVSMLDQKCSACIQKVRGGGHVPTDCCPLLAAPHPLPHPAVPPLPPAPHCVYVRVCACVCARDLRLLQIGDDDIEIDIDRVDAATFWSVDKFVKDCMGTSGDKKRRAEAGPSAGAGGGGAAGAGAGGPQKKVRA
jgi:hypothetical protein